MTGIKILPTRCSLCIEECNSNVVLNYCGNEKCDYLMCDECIVKLNSELCPVCRVKMSEEIIKKQNKNNSRNTNLPVSFNIESINNDNESISNNQQFINNLKKIIVKIYCQSFNKCAFIMFCTSLLLYLGNLLLICFGIELKNVPSGLLNYFIGGFLGGLIIIMILIVFLYIVINLYKCIRKECE
jgi:hypothetical protein